MGAALGSSKLPALAGIPNVAIPAETRQLLPRSDRATEVCGRSTARRGSQRKTASKGSTWLSSPVQRDAHLAACRLLQAARQPAFLPALQPQTLLQPPPS
eukprot:scaffold5067_cov245-Pinguiococcus_pyrenoidosus.AAC.4